MLQLPWQLVSFPCFDTRLRGRHRAFFRETLPSNRTSMCRLYPKAENSLPSTQLWNKNPQAPLLKKQQPRKQSQKSLRSHRHARAQQETNDPLVKSAPALPSQFCDQSVSPYNPAIHQTYPGNGSF